MTLDDFHRRMRACLPQPEEWAEYFDAVDCYRNQTAITRSQAFDALTGLRLQAMNGTADDMKRCEAFTNAIDAVFDDERLDELDRAKH